MSNPIRNAIFPLNQTIIRFMEQTLNQLEVNFITQRIWPYPVSEAYKIRNEANRQQGLPHSTGEGIKSFRGSLIHADSSGNFSLVVSFNDYLRYVDLGVGAGRKSGSVVRDKKARYKSRYVRLWNPESGDTHRPAIMMELRHLQSRIQSHLADCYSKQGALYMVETFDNLNIQLFDY